MKNLCQSLLKCHSNAYEKAKLSNQKFDQSALIDGLFTHEEAVQSHLNSMKFILQEGNLYLNLNRAQGRLSLKMIPLVLILTLKWTT